MSTKDLSLVPQERRLALIIGVNEAARSHLEPLNYALNDAEAVAQVLQEQCGFTLLEPPLLGKEATSDNVRKAVLALARQRTDADFLLLYFSGHGQPMTVSGDQPDIYLATSDFNEIETEEDEHMHCSMRWLQEKLYLPTSAGKVLLVLDCCYAGNMGRTASDPYLEDLKARINKYFGAPGSASGARSGGLRLALTATGHNKPAYEKDGHGTLTGWLLECLRGEIDEVIDLDNRGNVSLQRLHDYLLRVMPAYQNPSVAGDYAGRNCILAQYEQRANELRQQKRAIVNERPHTHIPLASSTSFQRRPELETFARLLFAEPMESTSPHVIIVGLIGMGGIGKTQLAVEIAYEYKERFPGGVFWTPAIGTSLIATVPTDGTVRVWDVTNGQMLALFVGLADTARNVAFSPDSKHIVLISSDTINIWDIDSEQVVASLDTLLTDKRSYWSIAFSSDGTSLFSSLDKGLYIWDIKQKKISARLFSYTFALYNSISGTAFSSEAKQIAIVSNTRIQILQIPDGQILLTCGHNTTVSSVAFSLDETKVVTGASDGTVRIWEITPMQVAKMEVMQSFAKTIESIVFSSAGTEAITLDSNTSLVRVWNVVDRKMIRTLQVDNGEWRGYIGLSSDGKKAGVGISGRIRIWDIEQDQEVMSFRSSISSSWYSCLALSSDGMNVAVAANQIVEIWSLNTQEVIAVLYGHEGSIEQIVFSSDSNKIITGATDDTVRIWDIASCTQLAVLKEYAGRCVCVSPDGSLVALGIWGNEVCVCSMYTGKRQLTLRSHTHPITTLSFSPSGRSLISSDESGQVLFWHVDGAAAAVPQGVYLAANEIAAIHWQDEQHVILADRGGTDNHPHFYHLALEGDWGKIF